MKSTFVYMFVEQRLDHARGSDDPVWFRKFPKHKQQVEYLREDAIYIRGMGGGFALYFHSRGEDWVIFQKSTGQYYRIAEEDYDRLVAKWKERNGTQRTQGTGSGGRTT